MGKLRHTLVINLTKETQELGVVTDEGCSSKLAVSEEVEEGSRRSIQN